MIERRVLGRTGLEVGLLGLGGANHGQVTQVELERIIDRAAEVGTNCLSGTSPSLRSSQKYQSLLDLPPRGFMPRLEQLFFLPQRFDVTRIIL